jgi:hypothetical protein
MTPDIASVVYLFAKFAIVAVYNVPGLQVPPGQAAGNLTVAI